MVVDDKYLDEWFNFVNTRLLISWLSNKVQFTHIVKQQHIIHPPLSPLNYSLHNSELHLLNRGFGGCRGAGPQENMVQEVR